MSKQTKLNKKQKGPIEYTPEELKEMEDFKVAFLERKEIIESIKPYKQKLKRHTNSVIHLQHHCGKQNGILISGSADKSVRIWDLNTMKISNKIELYRPTLKELYEMDED